MRSTTGNLGNVNARTLTPLALEELKKFKSNQDYFRQNEAIFKQIPLEERFKFDKSLDFFFKNFC